MIKRFNLLKILRAHLYTYRIGDVIYMKRKIALVTGATGFIGSQLVRDLVSKDWDVYAIIRSSSNIEMIKSGNKNINFMVHNGTTESMLNIVDSVKPSTVFHLASNFLPQHNSSDIIPLIHSNILFGTQLVEAMVKCECFSLVNVGTSWQHYNNEIYNPVCLYAATKQAFETIIDYFVQVSPLQVISLKLFDTYGPNDSRQKLITLLNKITITQEPLEMSPGEQLIDIVYIDDVIRAFLIAAKRLETSQSLGHEKYAVSSGQPIALKELVSLYEKVRQVNLPINWGGRPYRNREVMIPWNNGVSIPGWKAEILLEEGIGKTIYK